MKKENQNNGPDGKRPAVLAVLERAVSRDRVNLDPGLLEEISRVYPETQDMAGEARHRWQDRVIVSEIPKGAYVLDLGCGTGELLGQLIGGMGVHGQAVEVDPEAAMVAMEHGVPVLNIDISEVLSDFSDQSFDYVILESTIQTLKDPMNVLSEVLRVGKRCVVSFPNFGHWRTRYDLAVKGRMPVTESLPYQWYDTPNIRVLTFSDFMDWCAKKRVNILASYGLVNGSVRTITEKDNLMVKEALMFISQG
ncbi:MAG: methionine biosynthesis protein MetW [Deltaproteobacteria bacterium]|nr:methionine biosynthesis protein MetW [Deltaproteobacteria bacterium]